MKAVDFISDNLVSFWDTKLGSLKLGDVLQNYQFTRNDDSIPKAEACLLHARFGAVVAPEFKSRTWRLDWSDGAKPTLYLSVDLFAHVADVVEDAE